MTLPDFTQEVLDYLSGNWDTNNFSPQPTLIDGDEWRDDADDSRARSVDVVNENVVTVDSDPVGTNTPVGSQYDNAFRFGVRVICEGYHSDGGGQLTDKDAFNSLVGEARRSVLEERTTPVSSAGEYATTHLTVENENDGSPGEGDAHYFRYEFEVWFHGFETLP